MIPVEIGGADASRTIPPYNMEIVREIRDFVVEDVRTARRFLRRWDRTFPIDECTFHELNGHTADSDISGYLDALRQGRPVGVMSEAGCPGVADPGSAVVAIAQREGLKVIPLVGPSSILLSLMGSGFNGQGFCFNGYLPVKDDERVKAVKTLESRCISSGMTQIFIETPYRNMKMLSTLCDTLRPDTLLCVACDITTDDEYIRTMRVADWKRERVNLEKRPAIFLIHAAGGAIHGQKRHK